MSKELGELRPSQLLFYHGPGAIVDMITGSVMIQAADYWKTSSEKIEDERIKRILGVPYIKLLNENQDITQVKAIQFPKWKICPKCNMMSNKKGKECYFCKRDHSLDITLFPSRFVLACKEGHIQDFPWDTWVHRGKSCETPFLKMEHKGMVGSLSDMSVRCVKCKAKRSLGEIMKEEVPCSGERPWIGDKQNCENTMEPVLRGAAKLYSPVLTSVLSIPLSEGEEESLVEKVNKHKEAIKVMKTLPEEQFKTLVANLLQTNNFEIVEIEQILDGDYEEQISYETIRKQEWNTLIQGNSNIDDSDYKARKIEIHEEMKSYFSSIIKIDSLPEIQVLRGFTRLHYPDPFDTEDITISPIMSDRATDWLPAVKNLGEGIFFQFDWDKIMQWERKKPVQEESLKIFNRYNNRRGQLGSSALSLKERHLLIHTFSHAMIQEFASFSGYATTSLRERIYCSEDMYGVLIYTASPDSEGSLGGLIELSKPEKLYPIFIRALERMEYCSSDPHCSDAEFEMQSTINGAACHACTFVSETSCEWGNQLLDRRILVPISNEKNIAFFKI